MHVHSLYWVRFQFGVDFGRANTRRHLEPARTSATLNYIIAILPPTLLPLTRTHSRECDATLQKNVLCKNEKLLRFERVRRLIWNVCLNIIVPRDGKRGSSATIFVCFASSSAIQRWKMHSISFYFYFRIRQCYKITLCSNKAHNNGQLALFVVVSPRILCWCTLYGQRFHSIFISDRRRGRRHRPWMTNDRWHGMPLVWLHLILKSYLRNRKHIIRVAFIWRTMYCILRAFVRRYLYQGVGKCHGMSSPRVHRHNAQCAWAHMVNNKVYISVINFKSSGGSDGGRSERS